VTSPDGTRDSSGSARAAKHSSATVEQYTPVDVVELGRETLGAIDTDPASCEFAQRVVRATTWYGEADDGLSRQWIGNTWVNPPGGALPRAIHGTKSSQAAWWCRTVLEWERDSSRSVLFLAFSLELLQACQGSEALAHPTELPCCFPARRIHFDVRARDRLAALEAEAADPRTGEKRRRAIDAAVSSVGAGGRTLAEAALADARWSGDQPTHGNLLVLLPSGADAVRRFRQAFGGLGHVQVPAGWR
jgi:hypothetical protein